MIQHSAANRPTIIHPSPWRRGHLVLLLLLACWCSGGCAHRHIYFDSSPRGAMVSYDSRQCITPCTLKTDCASGQAQLNHPIAGERVVKVEACEVGDTIRYHAMGTTELAFKVAATPFALVGLVGLAIISDDADNGDSTDPDVWLITGGSLLTAGVLYGCGEGFGHLKGDLDTEVHVTFPPAATSAASQLEPRQEHSPAGQALPDTLQLDGEDYQRLFDRPAPAQ